MVPSTCRDDLAKLLKQQLNNHGSCTFYSEQVKVKYSVKGTRASGDMNTSSGNCFTMVLLVYSYMQTLGIKWRLANNGDDCVLMVEKRDQHRLGGLQKWFAEMGFTMESEGAQDTFEKLVFCQTQPVWTPRGWTMVRQLTTAIAKDTHTRCDLSRKDVFDNWCNAMHHGGLSLAGNIPIYNAFYHCYPTSTTRVH